MVDLVHLKNSKYLRIKIKLFDQVNLWISVNGGGGKIIPLRYTLSFNILERSSSFI